MKIKKILFLLMTVMISCETTVNVDLPDKQPELVINSIVRPDSSFWVEVSNTSPISTDIDIQPIKNAEVKVIANNSDEYKLDLVEVADEDGTGDGQAGEVKVYYRLNSLAPEIGSRYQIEVETPKYGTATAPTQKVLPKPDVSITDFQYRVDYSHTQVHRTGPVPYRFDVEFEVKDNANRQNYYHIGVYDFQDWSPKEFSSDDVALVSHFDDQVLDGDSSVREKFVHFASFNDRLFNGKTKKIRIRFFKTFAPGISPFLRFQLSSITPDLYEYHKSMRETEERVKLNGVSLPLSEPIRIFNNIKGGYGIFGVYSPSTFIWNYDTQEFIQTPD